MVLKFQNRFYRENTERREIVTKNFAVKQKIISCFFKKKAPHKIHLDKIFSEYYSYKGGF